MNLTLTPGYKEYQNILNEQEHLKITLVRTWVNSWSINVNPGVGSDFRIYNSTLALMYAYVSTRIYVQGSNVSAAYFTGQSSLTLFNSIVGTLYAYNSANITAINSNIDIIIRDPPEIKLQDSLIGAEITIPFSISSDELSASVSDDNNVPLPENVQHLGMFLHVMTSSQDSIPAQVKIHYDESELKRSGVNEANLQIYHLDELGSRWQACVLQGVNETGNYVWTNVTHFCYFVLVYARTLTILSLTTSKSIIGQGFNLLISVEVTNYGIDGETFNTTVYANTTIIDTLTDITLVAKSSAILTFSWNTSSCSKGSYTISDTVEWLNGNLRTTGDNCVLVTVPGDADGNFQVDIYDVTAICVCYDSKLGPPRDPLYYPNCDLDGNGVIDIFDVTTACITYGQKYP
jgi:hypothetical protein